MDDRKHPLGAIRTLDEIQALLKLVKAGEKVVLWPVSIGDGDGDGYPPPAVKNFTPCTPRILYYSTLLGVDTPNRNKIALDLKWRHIGSDKGFGYLFTNYWHAYAYKLRQRAKQSA